MEKFTVGVCGNFDTENTPANGQTVKTVNLRGELEKIYGKGKVKRFNTYGFKKNPIKSVGGFLRLIRECENVVMLPSLGAVKILVPIAAFYKKKYGCRVYYSVIGAWIGKVLKRKRHLLAAMKKLDGIFSETQTLKNELEELGLENVEIMVNFKNMPLQSEQDMPKNYKKPFALCYMSRITEMKGIGELVETIKKVNREEIRFTLDIYGPVEKDYAEHFEGLRKNFPEYIKYKGVASSDKASEILKDSFVQVFPTKYATEGIPGSVIDSYFAGVPVLAARWNSCYDIIDEGITGITFELGNFSQLEERLAEIAENPEKVLAMKPHCLKKAELYNPDNAIKVLTSKMEVKE